MIFMDAGDDCDAVVDAMLETGYSEEFCVALNWDSAFIARLMDAGFLVMSETYPGDDIVLPKLHLVRSVLFFPELHIKKSIRRCLGRYELRFNDDFERITANCIKFHGEGWLTPSLMKVLFALREQNGAENPCGSPAPVSFALYRDGELTAGEFGIVCGGIYTSYSGYTSESNAGTVQMILMIKWLEEAGFDFLDFGMPLEYKTDMGARSILPDEFVRLWRKGRKKPLPLFPVQPE